MEAFEKWNKPHRLNDLAMYGETYKVKWNERERKSGWRAALEWVIQNNVCASDIVEELKE